MRVTRKTLVTAPTVEPVTLAEAKTFANIDANDEDALINSLIKAARQYVETTYNVALITQTWDFFLDRFPQYVETSDPKALIEPVIKPLIQVRSIIYYDGANQEQNVNGVDFEVVANDYGWPQIHRAYNVTWPETYVRQDAVKVRVDAGFGPTAASVPEPVKLGMLVFIKFLFDNREDMPVKPYVRTADLLLKNYFGHDL